MDEYQPWSPGHRFDWPALYQGTTLDVPKRTQIECGLSPCNSSVQGLKPKFYLPIFGTTEVVP
jgi:hypothetical protein